MQSLNDVQTRKLLLVSLAEYLQVTLTESQVVAYEADLCDLSPDDLGLAIKNLRKSGDTFYNKFPFPWQIRKFFSGSKDDVALEIAMKIIKAIAIYGWPDPYGASKFIGFTGWSVVQAYGGWRTVCQMIDEPEKISIYQSQFSKTALMMLNQSYVRREGGNLLEEKEPIGTQSSSTHVSLGQILSRLAEKNGSQSDGNKQDIQADSVEEGSVQPGESPS